MSTEPPTTRGARAGRNQDPGLGQGPVEQLLQYTETILKLESRLQFARRMRRFTRLAITILPIGLLAIYVATDLTWRKQNLRSINAPVIFFLGVLVIYLVIYFIAALDDRKNSEPLLDVSRIQLDLDIANERRHLFAASIDLELSTRQLIYRDGVPQDIERYRGEAKYYRRIHNFLQAVIIIGALAASTLTSLIQSIPELRWAAVATSFSVGVAAGFTGYFKFRERSFYLQQTSDSIEQELSAVNLGIGRYRGKQKEEALTEFTEQTELLKVEQRYAFRSRHSWLAGAVRESCCRPARRVVLLT